MKKNTFVKFMMVLMMVIMPQTGLFAQDLNSVLQGIVSGLGEKVSEKVAGKTDILSIEGSWIYVKPDCKFESDNALSKAGGELVSAKLEQKTTEILKKMGVTDRAVFTFNEDGTYKVVSGKRTTTGTYVLNKETGEIQMTSRLGFNFNGKVLRNVLAPKKMSLLFNSDKLVALAQTITGRMVQKSSHAKSLDLINGLLSDCKGMKLGIEMERM